MKLILKNQEFLKLLLFAIFYLICFFLLEQRQVNIHIIHCAIDEWIPFVEVFIIPYVLWYFYVIICVCYLAFFEKNQNEFKRLSKTLMIGMVVFLVISFSYPNGHQLRPIIHEKQFFYPLLSLLHHLDTPTNILPSLHVFFSIACGVAINQNESCHKKRIVRYMNILLSISIILSTMFIKQHSFIDVVGAFVLYWFCYQIFYKTVK